MDKFIAETSLKQDRGHRFNIEYTQVIQYNMVHTCVYIKPLVC